MISGGMRYQVIKTPVDADRIRHMPAQFAPVDRRLVYDRHICRLTHNQISLFLFLQCVSDAAGLSYYSDERICEYLNLPGPELRLARQDLIRQNFLLYRKPIYQLLDLPLAVPSRFVFPAPDSGKKTTSMPDPAEAIPIAVALKHLSSKEFRS